ncbi:MAG: histidine--tRNA ligase [Candidatus Pacearchaeota archaeon]|jgi:histidyl-tRNA synthetase
MTIETVKGFRDIFFDKALKRKYIRSIIEKNMNLFGFFPLETPTIEYEDLLKGDNENDEAVSDRFRLQDRGKRELGLRFEFTFQLSRIFKENPNIKLPFKRYEIGSVFRDEALRPGKYREFTQCDADIVGDPSIKADSECIALGFKILKDLNINAEIKVNNRKLMNSILDKSSINKNQQQILRELDKLDKLGENEVKKNLSKYIKESQTKNIFDFLSKDIDYFLKNKFNGADEIKELIDYGNIYGYKISFTPTLMRGFSYYTGNVWEIWAKDKEVALAGGGRYDDKVGKYSNRNLPSVGISFGTLLDWEDIKINENRLIIISLDQDKTTIEIANELRFNNISCTIFYGKPSKALEYANSYNIDKVLFVGEEEVKKKKFKLKDLSSGKEEFLTITELQKKLN